MSIDQARALSEKISNITYVLCQFQMMKNGKNADKRFISITDSCLLIFKTEKK